MTKPTDQAAFGTLERQGDLAVLRYERHLAYPPAKVWRAITEPEHLADWFPTTIEGERTPGAALTFSFREMKLDSFAGKMRMFDPPSLLEFEWGDDTLRFELSAETGGTRLQLTVTFVELGKVARDGAGWHACLDRLVHLVDGTDVSWEGEGRWRDVHPVYVERFGPELSALGPPEEYERVHGSGDTATD
jgi:uncharacterized protein YndB with AHSA1/START domain